MLSGHRFGIIALEQPALGKRAHSTPAHLRLDFGNGFGTHALGFAKAGASFAGLAIV